MQGLAVGQIIGCTAAEGHKFKNSTALRFYWELLTLKCQCVPSENLFDCDDNLAPLPDIRSIV